MTTSTPSVQPAASGVCPHGMPLADNVCGPCSQGRPNRVPGTGQQPAAAGVVPDVARPADYIVSTVIEMSARGVSFDSITEYVRKQILAHKADAALRPAEASYD